MIDFDREIAAAVERGYPSSHQRRTWTQFEWAAFNTEMDKKGAKDREAYEAGNSPERLRELINDLTERVQDLEGKA